jgi:hypothetical protein
VDGFRIALLVLLTACGGARPSAAPRTRAAPSVEHFQLAIGDALQIDGERFWFGGMDPGGEGAPPEAGFDHGERSIHVPVGYCARDRDWIWHLDAFDEDAPAHLSRTRAMSDRDARYDREVRLEDFRGARFADGNIVRPSSTRFFGRGRIWTFQVQKGEWADEVTATLPEGVAASEPEPFGDAQQYVLTLRVGDGSGALGCPLLFLTIEHPAARLARADVGRPLRLSMQQTGEIGAWRIRPRTVRRAMHEEGERYIVEIEVARTGAEWRSVVVAPPDIELLEPNLALEVVEVEENAVTVRLSRR